MTENNFPTTDELFKHAEELWSLIMTKANHILAEIVHDASHDILNEIANEKQVQWPHDIKALAKALRHQGDVAGLLDELRIREKGHFKK